MTPNQTQDAIAEFMMTGLVAPHRSATKDELWKFIDETVREMNAIRRVFLAHTANRMVREQNPLYTAVAGLFDQLDKNDPEWRQRVMGHPLPGPTQLAWEAVNNALNQEIKPV
jgi:hypothetical protein